MVQNKGATRREVLGGTAAVVGGVAIGGPALASAVENFGTEAVQVESLVGKILHPNLATESVAAFKSVYAERTGGEQSYTPAYALLECVEEHMNLKGERVVSVKDHNANGRIIADLPASLLVAETATSRGPGIFIDDNPNSHTMKIGQQGMAPA